jgi:hypothetical protein
MVEINNLCRVRAVRAISCYEKNDNINLRFTWDYTGPIGTKFIQQAMK